MFTYKPTGVCAKEIQFDIKDGKITKVSFIGGCEGNLKGLSSLLEGMNVDEAIKRLEGINCHNKGTSCPDQFAHALKEHIK
ncbi:TIGR03905 family protein [Clostridiaceae bacterium 14S0207]|nr:TIGR03905 family protein [Clostridiaceae bacterium 14S0207]